MSFSNIWRRISSFPSTRAPSPSPQWIPTGNLPLLVLTFIIIFNYNIDWKRVNYHHLLIYMMGMIRRFFDVGFFFMVFGLFEQVVCLVVDWRLNLFSELAPPELMLRKLVSVTDLTICLDQCNAQGKIPIYQVNLMILWDSLRCLQEGLKISGADEDNFITIFSKPFSRSLQDHLIFFFKGIIVAVSICFRIFQDFSL